MSRFMRASAAAAPGWRFGASGSRDSLLLLHPRLASTSDASSCAPSGARARRSHTLGLLSRGRPRKVGRLHATRKGRVENECPDALRQVAAKQDRQRSPIGETELRSALGTCSVHDRADVVHPSLDVRTPATRSRKACPSLVELDQPREGGEGGPRRQRAQRIGPVQLDVRDEARHEDDVEGPSPVTV